MLREHREAELGAPRTLLTFEEEGLRDDADCAAAFLARELGDDRRRSRSGAAAHPRGDEDHVGAGQHFLEARHVLERGFAAFLGIGTCAETARYGGPNVHLLRRKALSEGLRVGIDDDEFDALEPEIDHGVHGIAAGTTAPDHLDPGLITTLPAGKIDGETHGWTLPGSLSLSLAPRSVSSGHRSTSEARRRLSRFASIVFEKLAPSTRDELQRIQMACHLNQ